jgi:hypothetical protein
MLKVSARNRDGGKWGDCEFRARSVGSAFATAAKRLKLRGPILSTEKVGSEQWLVNVDGTPMMVIIHSAVP